MTLSHQLIQLVVIPDQNGNVHVMQVLAMQVFVNFNSLYSSTMESQSEEYENPLLLLLRSLLPHYNPTVTIW